MAGLDVSLSSTKSEVSERVNEANALMEETVEEFTEEELTWWNATLDKATSTEIDEIVKLYESLHADVNVERNYDSLNPIIMQCIRKYREGSYGRQKADHLLSLAAYRAGLHLTKSSAVKLFSDALLFIGYASYSYQEEHPNKSGGLVLVLIKQMEMLLSVAGWCLASGVVSKENYSSIVEKLFSGQHNHVVDLIFCISNVAVTCTVEEELTRMDYLVFLRCNNLYEVIDIEMSYASARAEAEFSDTIIIEDEKKYMEEGKEEEICDNEEKAFSTEVDAFAFMISLLSTNEGMNGENEERDDNGLGFFDLTGKVMKGRGYRETYDHFTSFDVEHLNNGVSSSPGINKQYQNLGNDHKDRGNAESRDLSVRFRLIERKDIHSPSEEEISGLGLRSLHRESSDFKCMAEMVWEWIISIGVGVGVSVVSIGKWICQAILAATSLPITSGAPLVFLLVMLLAPPKTRVYTLAKSNGQFIRHQRNNMSIERGLTNTSFLESYTTTHGPDCRQPLIFDWGIDNPYTFERQKEGKKPFTLASGCEETQRCLFMPDEKMFNIISGGDAVFPIFENLLSERSPSIEQVLANAEILYDDKSVEIIQGIGTYYGPIGIGEYKLVPRFVQDGEFAEVAKFVASPTSFFTEIEYVVQENWHHLNQTQTANWIMRYNYYPCSAIRKREDLAFPPQSARAFSDSGKVDGTVESVCEVVMEHCTGEITQYNSTEECISFLGSLPHHDPRCQNAFGEYSAMGSSFMCKYLHHFMIPLSPATHCAHVGKGLPDSTGGYKCVATDCQEDKSKQLNGLTEPSCDEADLEELVQGIIYALPFCLPSLEMQVCMSNCTQAINTYLGRFAEKGVIDSCNTVEVLGSSRLLSLISVDAHALLHLCSADALLAVDILSSHLLDEISIPTCSGVNEYLGSGLKCLEWNWNDISQGIYDEWSANYDHQRVTQSDNIATAECHVFSQLYSQYLNIQYTQILDDASNLKKRNIQIHPNGHPVILSHEQVSMAFKETQSRDGMGVTFGHCEIPGKTPDWMQNKLFQAPSQDTNTTAHKSARQFIISVLQGLSTKPTAPPARENLFDKRGLIDDDELFRCLSDEHFRALLGDLSPKSDFFWTGDVIDDVRDLIELSVSYFFPESWHRAQGYLTGIAYAALRQSLGRKLRDEFTSLREVIDSLLPQFNNVSSSNEYLAYDAMIDALGTFTISVAKLTGDIVKFVRRDPCKMVPLWNDSPERFVVEYSRLHSPVPGFDTHSNSGKSPIGLRYQIASANRDPEVFLDPLSFDPDRSDLDQIMTWNFIEGEGPSSHARWCPGRSFTVQFVVSHAERYFPNDVTCANNIKVHNDVELSMDYIDIRDGSKLQVLKTSTGSNTLFLFLHGFPDVPQEFAPIISHLQLQSKLEADYWMLNGWSTSKCKITQYAEQVANLISESKVQSQYDKVFLVGHDFGGLVGWVVAGMLSKDVLSGFISFSPSPQVFSKSLSMFPASKVPFYHLMKPLAGSTYLATKNFQLLDDLMTNETFWPEYRDEYHQMWDEIGAHDLTCVYRENFDVIGGSIALADLDISEEAIETDILLISGEDDMFYPRKLYHTSIGTISPKRGQRLFHKEVHDSTHRSILHDHSKETAHHIEMFAKSVNRKRLSLWSRITIPPQVHSSYYEEVSSDTITFYVYILTFVVMLTGIIMELTIGQMLVGKLGFSVYLFAQIMAATINFGCFFAANLITLPLYTIGLFKFGYPEVTGHILGPIRSPEFYYDNKSFRVMSFISGIAYVVHHTGGTIGFMVVSLHEMNPLSLGFVILPVGFQHLVVFIKYRFKHLHAFLLLCLEVWFQLESYYALTFATTSARVSIGMLLISHYIWFVHGVMKSSLEIFMTNNVSDGKVDDKDEEDPDRSKTKVNKRHTLLMYSSSFPFAAKSSEIDEDEDEDEPLPPPQSTPSTQRKVLFEGSSEEEKRSKNENANSMEPATLTQGSRQSRRRSTRQHRESLRLFDSNEVMHLMGFDDEF